MNFSRLGYVAVTLPVLATVAVFILAIVDYRPIHVVLTISAVSVSMVMLILVRQRQGLNVGVGLWIAGITTVVSALGAIALFVAHQYR
jgi:hypothetical protein